MDTVAKGLVLVAGGLWLAACGGTAERAAGPPPSPPAQPLPPPPAPKPVVVLAASPALVAPGAAAELRWSSPGAETCTALGGWTGARPPGGRETSPAITAETAFTIRCDGPGGTAESTVVVSPEPPVHVVDRHGRPLGNGREGVLVDWEGEIANPAIELFLVASPSAALPVTVTVATDDPRLSLDAKTAKGPDGGRRTLTIDGPSPVRFRIANYPDEDTADDAHALHVTTVDALGAERAYTVPLREVDQDRDRPLAFEVTVDFSQDTEAFFADEARREIVRHAARGWAYFFADMALDPVAAGFEWTYFWNSHPDGFKDGYSASNTTGYRGFLLYAQGFHSDRQYSAGSGSVVGRRQTSGGVALPLCRSGSIQIEMTGDYGVPGWYLSTGSDDWWHDWRVEMDLLHIVNHEVGHALVLSSGNPRAAAFKNAGAITDERVRAYLGEDPAIDANYHLRTVVDPESGRGAFGNHYASDMPLGRWLPTKLDLLVAQAVGYELRDVSAFAALQLAPHEPARAHVGAPYAEQFDAHGGIPFYRWTLTAGALPDGLALDPYDGIVYGTPTTPGAYGFTLGVEEYGGAVVSRAFELSVE